MSESMADEGRLPDFIIVGTQKGGTTSLQHHLRKHPQIEMAPNLQDPRGEPHFFTQHYDRGVAWYRTLFRDNGKIQGEKTPNYLLEYECHPRLRAVVPSCRLVAILRDPVERVESAFNHATQLARQKGVPKLWGWNTQLTFEQNLKEHIAGGIPNYVRCGCYMDHLESLLRHFPREQLLVLISEEYRRVPAGTLHQLFRFVGAEPIDAILYNSSIHQRVKEATISAPCKAWLRDYYAPFNQRLFEFLGREIPDWG